MNFLEDRKPHLSDFYGVNDFNTVVEDGELYIQPFDMMQTFQRIMYEVGLFRSPQNEQH